MSPETAQHDTARESAGARIDRDGVDPRLDRAERMLLYAVRRIAAGGDRCPATRREFAGILGPLAEETLAAFRCFFWTLAAFGRRRLAVGFPGAGTISCDERLLLVVFAAAQAAADDRLDAHLSFLAGGADHRFLAATATVVAKALAAAGHRLPLPAPIRPAATRPPQLALTSFCRLRSPSGRGSSGLICGHAVHDTSPT
jgi:hypothetical protein